MRDHHSIPAFSSNRWNKALIPSLLALALCACGSDTFFKDISTRIDTGQVDRIPTSDLAKLAAGKSDYAKFVFAKWKLLYCRKAFKDNADPVDMAAQIFVIEAVGKAGNDEAKAFLPRAEEYLRTLNVHRAAKAKAPEAEPSYTDFGPVEVVALRVQPATDVLNPYYVYRKVVGTVRNRSSEMVVNATLTVRCYDVDGHLIGLNELPFENLEAGVSRTFSEEIRDLACTVKPLAMRY